MAGLGERKDAIPNRRPLYEKPEDMVVWRKENNRQKRGGNLVNLHQMGNTGGHGVAHLSIFGTSAIEKKNTNDYDQPWAWSATHTDDGN